MDFDDLVEKKKIDLGSKDLCDGGLGVLVEVVRKSNVLEELGLYGNRLTLADGKMAEAIAHSQTLRRLVLGKNQIDDEGAKRLADAIKVNETLRKISLWNNKIGDEGAKSLAEALAENKSLRMMDLERNKIGDEGARSLAASLKTNQSLQRIYLVGTNITDEGALRLAGALKENYTIGVLDVSSHRARKEINAILNDKSRRRVRKLIASKDAENAALKQSLDAKDRELKDKEEEIASLNSLKESIKPPPEVIEYDRQHRGFDREEFRAVEQASSHGGRILGNYLMEYMAGIVLALVRLPSTPRNGRSRPLSTIALWGGTHARQGKKYNS